MTFLLLLVRRRSDVTISGELERHVLLALALIAIQPLHALVLGKRTVALLAGAHRRSETHLVESFVPESVDHAVWVDVSINDLLLCQALLLSYHGDHLVFQILLFQQNGLLYPDLQLLFLLLTGLAHLLFFAILRP